MLIKKTVTFTKKKFEDTDNKKIYLRRWPFYR